MRPRGEAWGSDAQRAVLHALAEEVARRSGYRVAAIEALRSDGNGKTKIDRVMIIFGNGQRQTVELDAKLNKKSPNVSIDLQGNTRNIDKIVVVGKTNGRNGSLDILAL